VNVASKAALDHEAGLVHTRIEGAALALMDSWRGSEGRGVRVNSILPSIIDTEATGKHAKADFAKWPNRKRSHGDFVLCSDDAAVIHGAAIPVYGK